MHSEKQKLQKQRSWFKFQLSGIKWLIEDKYLTPFEKHKLDTIKYEINQLKLVFEEKSKLLGLNVPEHKCWCVKKGVTTIPDFYNPSQPLWVCNKHKNDK